MDETFTSSLSFKVSQLVTQTRLYLNNKSKPNFKKDQHNIEKINICENEMC